MPSKSKAQRNFMAAAAHNPEFAKKAGIPVSVAKEFNAADKGKKFKSGGNVANLKKLFKGKDTKAEELKEAKAIKSGKITPEQYAKGEEMEKGMKKGGCCKMAKGGKVKKYAGGGSLDKSNADKGIAAIKFSNTEVKEPSSPPKTSLSSAEIANLKSEMFKKARAEERANTLPPKSILGEDVDGYRKGGATKTNDKVKKYAKGGVTRADGCVKKGHTKGRMV